MGKTIGLGRRIGRVGVVDAVRRAAALWWMIVLLSLPNRINKK